MSYSLFSKHERGRYRRSLRPGVFFVVLAIVLAGGIYFTFTFTPQLPSYMTLEQPFIEPRLIAEAHVQALIVHDWQSFFSSYAPDVSIAVREGEHERVFEGLLGARTLWLGENSRSRDILSLRIRDVEPIFEAHERDSFTVLLKLRRPLSGIKEWRSVFIVREGRVAEEHLEAVPEVVIMPSEELSFVNISPSL